MDTQLISGGLALLLAIAGGLIALSDKFVRSKSKSSGVHKAIKRELFSARDNLPEALRSATLLMSEKTLTIRSPVYKKGTPDQVWDVCGTLYISDTKTRTKIKPTDIEQMSIYRILLEKNGYENVANTAYVRLAARGKSTRWEPVTLLSQVKATELLISRTKEGRAISDSNGGVC